MRESKTLAFAIRAHKGQEREFGEGAYINHCIRVANAAAEWTNHPHLIQTALLHDTVEDTHVTLDDIKSKFGLVVAGVVRDVTNRSKEHPDLSRGARKTIDLYQIRASSVSANFIRVLDIKDNLQSIINSAPEERKNQFLHEKRGQVLVIWSLYKHNSPGLEAVTHKLAADLYQEIKGAIHDKK